MRASTALARRTDWTVYHVTDAALSGGRDRVPAVVAEAVLGGARVIQVRDKDADDAVVADLVRECRSAIGLALGAEAAEVALFVDDRLEVAVELGCHLHVGQSDTPAAAARRALGPSLMLGLSVSDVEEARRGLAAGDADVFGIGPVLATSTKTDAAAPLGVDGVEQVLRALGRDPAADPTGDAAPRPPAVAIGGIDLALARALGGIGIDGICAVSAIAAAPSPRDAARSLGAAVRAGRENRSRAPA